MAEYVIFFSFAYSCPFASLSLLFFSIYSMNVAPPPKGEENEYYMHLEPTLIALIRQSLQYGGKFFIYMLFSA
jgi:hypothetical protein